jgi:DNA-binding NarL/FixJ family response regulator
MSVVNIVLADDHHLVRQGVRALLEADPNFRVIGEAGDGLEALRLVQELRPDFLIVDVRMPGLSGLEVTRQVSERSRQTRVLIMSMYDNEAYLLEAMRNGAAGYILKDNTAAELLEAVHEVAAGQRYLSQALSKRTIDAYVREAQGTTPDPYKTLTSREREVLHLVVEGNTNAKIGRRLHISPRTVEIHRASVMHKLGLRTQTDLILYAVDRGILPI